MHVLRVISSMNPAAGGPCQGIRNSIPAVAKLGVTTEVVSCDAPDSPWLGSDLFSIHAVGPGKFGYAYSPRLLPWLIENLPRFDVVIIHGLWLWPSIATRIALRKLGKTASLTGSTGFSGAAKDCVSSVQIREIRGSTIAEQQATINPKHRVPRCFVMPHGMLDPYFQRAPERRVKAIRNWIYWKLIEHRVVNSADGVLFTCEEEKRLAREPFRPYQPKSEKVVKYGTPEPPPYVPAMRDAFAAACPGLGDQPYILFLGRIHQKKGVDMLIRAYAKLQTEFTELSESNSGTCGSIGLSPSGEPTKVDSVGKSICEQSQASSVPEDFEAKSLLPHDEKPFCPIPSILSETHRPDHPATPATPVNPVKNASALPALVIAGPCHDPEYLRKLKAEIGKLKPENLSQVSSFKVQVSPSIHFVDMVSGAAKWGALYGCEAFILPSHQENFGIAVAEALACNKPVLISNKVNIWREIEADGAGLVEDDTDEGTENLLRRLLTEWTKLSESNSHSTDTNSVNYVSKVCFKKRFSIEQAAESMLRTIGG